MVTSKLFTERELKKLCNSYNSFFEKSFSPDYFDKLYTYYVYYRYLVRELGFNCRYAFDICAGTLEESDKDDFRNFTDLANLYLCGIITL